MDMFLLTVIVLATELCKSFCAGAVEMSDWITSIRSSADPIPRKLPESESHTSRAIENAPWRNKHAKQSLF